MCVCVCVSVTLERGTVVSPPAASHCQYWCMQIHFSVTKNSNGNEAIAVLANELDRGYLLGTLRLDQDSSDLVTIVRLNV